jgi:hypothetical protein
MKGFSAMKHKEPGYSTQHPSRGSSDLLAKQSPIHDRLSGIVEYLDPNEIDAYAEIVTAEVMLGVAVSRLTRESAEPDHSPTTSN